MRTLPNIFRSIFLATLFCLIAVETDAQPLSISIKPVFGKADMRLEETYFKLKSGDSIRVDLLRFYLSGLELLQNGEPVWKEQNSYHLVDAADIRSCNLAVNIPQGLRFNSIKFNLGIDSVTNVSGAMGGDLDPTRGMYWTWQSGYINFKLAGASNLCSTRKNQFQFHLGGYLSPYAALQTVTLNASGSAITVYFDVEKLLEGINLARQNEIMSPGEESIVISKLAAQAFRTK